MRAIQGSAELAIRNLFKRLANGAESKTLSAIDYMDDGTPIVLEVQLNGHDGSARFDFSGTGPEVLGKSFIPLQCDLEAMGRNALFTTIELNMKRPCKFAMADMLLPPYRTLGLSLNRTNW